jgi:hypothetical protein
MNTLSGKFGKFSVDCMANSANAICSKFYSRYSSPGTSGVNFFAQTLSQQDYHYCFPPVRKAVDAILHLEKFKVSGILVIPIWPRSQIFSWFFPDGVHASSWVLTLDLINPSFISSQSVGCCFKGLQTFNTAVLEFNFQNSFVSFDSKIHPDFCLRKGCSECL